MKKSILLFSLFVFAAIFLHAQKPVSAPQKNGLYEKKDKSDYVLESGMCTNGIKTGTWKYFELNYVKKEEDYSDAGILIETRIYKYGQGKVEMHTEVNEVYQGKYVVTFYPRQDTILSGWYTAGQKDKTWSYFRKLNGTNLWKNEIWNSGILNEVQIFYADGKVYERDAINAGIIYYDEGGNELGRLDEKAVLQKEMNDSLLRSHNSMRPPPPPPGPTITTQSTDTSHKEEVFTFAEQMPEFPGGNSIQVFLQQNIHYPVQAQEMGISGTVYISFVVNKYGGIEQIYSIKTPPGGQLLEKEAIRVINMMPPFTVGKMNGYPVMIQMTQPVKFSLQ